jgi:hypothetical protein
MTEQNDKTGIEDLNRETEDLIHQIILACGKRPLKEKVSFLYLTIDYIFHHNKDLQASFDDKITFH